MVEEVDKKMRQATLHNLTEQREHALARVREAIEEMTKLLAGMALDSPHRYLAEMLLKTLHKSEDRLAGGLIHRSSRRG